MSEPLACPLCATTHSLDERFCPSCGMPLVYAGAQGMEASAGSGRIRAGWGRVGTWGRAALDGLLRATSCSSRSRSARTPCALRAP